MRVLMLEAPEEFLAERRRRGLGKRDEMWEGVLHLVPPRWTADGQVTPELLISLRRIAEARGLVGTFGMALIDKDDNYRIPDLTYALRRQLTKRGIERRGCELIIEVLSPNDESYEKLDFYAMFPVREVLIVDPEARAFELFALRRGKYVKRRADRKGRVRSEVLGVTFATRRGPKLEIAGPLGTTAI